MNSFSVKSKILFIEDNDDHWQLIQQAIQESIPNAVINRVANRTDALLFLASCVDKDWETPDLILLDLYLPSREEGWLILQEIKALPTPFRYIPVVMLSYSDNPKDITEAYNRGISSYLVKPTAYQDWLLCFQLLKEYWWTTATLPKTHHIF